MPRYSFSGTDADCWAWVAGHSDQGIVHLETIHTISISIHEAKGQVRKLGKRGIGGLTRSVRTIAGSMIFVVVDDHPLRELQILDSKVSGKAVPLGWSMDKYTTGTGFATPGGAEVAQYNNKLGTLLRPFTVLIQHVTEYPSQLSLANNSGQVQMSTASELITGIEFIDEGKVTSVNDTYTEITYSFIAKDYKPLSANVVDLKGTLDDASLNQLIAETEGFEERVNNEILAILNED